MRAVAWVAAVVTLGATCMAQGTADGSTVIEIRVYTLKSGTREGFHDLFVRQSLPLLQRHGIDVVAYGPSVHDADSYYLVRAFASLHERTRIEDAFYASQEWTNGPRQAVLAAIETYSTVVVEVDAPTLRALRGLMPAKRTGAPDVLTKAADVATLLALNDDYIQSVQASDVARFREILAEDFLCSLPDGSQVDRRRFLEQIAAPATIRNLQAHDVNVRVMGDFALVHARTTFTAADGRPGGSRYTDVWARRDGRWVAIAAQVTRY
jgi:ketosteroid isomerase-like protein